MKADFYFLTRTPIQRALPAIAERVLAGRERLLIVADDDQLQLLDEAMWTYKPESFLPHGREADQPIILANDCAANPDIANVALADGIWRETALSFQRAFYFFDEASLDSARAAWRTLASAEGVERRYWKQDENGRWVEGP